MAICLAKHHRIPILNLAETDMRAAMDGLYRMAQIRDRWDLEQDLAISGGSADASPSVAPARSRHDKRDEDWWMATADQQERAGEPQKATEQHTLHL